MTTTRNQNLAIIGTLATFLFGGGGSALIWAADQRYEKKGAIGGLANQVQQNSEAQEATMASVDKLLVQVLMQRITELQKTIDTLRSQPTMTGAERGLLRQTERDLEDAIQERQVTLDRILGRRTQ